MSISFLQGGLTPGDNVILVYSKGQTLYVLNSYRDSSNLLRLIFDSGVVANVNRGKAASTVPVFVLSGKSYSSVKFNLANLGGGGLSADNQGKAGISTVAPTLSVSLVPFSDWKPPNLILSGAPYTIQTSSNVTITFDVGSLSSTGVPTIAFTTTTTNIFPVVWYYNCANSKFNTINTVESTICSIYCEVNVSDPICINGTSGVCADAPTQGWTTQDACFDNIVFQYCPAGQACGYQNCNGPCTNDLYSCELVNSSNYQCKFSTSNLFIGKWWLKPWFLITVAVIVVILVILIVTIVEVVKKNRS